MSLLDAIASGEDRHFRGITVLRSGRTSDEHGREVISKHPQLFCDRQPDLTRSTNRMDVADCANSTVNLVAILIAFLR